MKKYCTSLLWRCQSNWRMQNERFGKGFRTNIPRFTKILNWLPMMLSLLLISSVQRLQKSSFSHPNFIDLIVSSLLTTLISGAALSFQFPLSFDKSCSCFMSTVHLDPNLEYSDDVYVANTKKTEKTKNESASKTLHLYRNFFFGNLLQWKHCINWTRKHF